jgi:hypothetical protein
MRCRNDPKCLNERISLARQGGNLCYECALKRQKQCSVCKRKGRCRDQWDCEMNRMEYDAVQKVYKDLVWRFSTYSFPIFPGRISADVSEDFDRNAAIRKGNTNAQKTSKLEDTVMETRYLTESEVTIDDILAGLADIVSLQASEIKSWWTRKRPLSFTTAGYTLEHIDRRRRQMTTTPINEWTTGQRDGVRANLGAHVLTFRFAADIDVTVYQALFDLLRKPHATSRLLDPFLPFQC